MGSSLVYMAQLLGLTLLFLVILRRLLQDDHLVKVIFLAAGIALSNCVVWHFWQQLLLRGWFVIFLDGYCAALFLLSLFLSDKQLSQTTTSFSLAYFATSLFVYVLMINPLVLLQTPNLLDSVAIVVFSIVMVFFISSIFQSLFRQQAVKRKLFHFGPLLISPVINQLSRQVLVLLLTAGFYLFFVLQMVRYKSDNLHKTKPTRSIFKKKAQELLTLSINKMKEFNTRQKHFWFTHLFLIMALQLAYMIKQTSQLLINQHCVLCLMAADAAAALVGKKYGSVKLFKSKTLQGTIAFAGTFFLSYSYVQQATGALQLPVLLVFSILTAAAQLLSGDCDNIATALVFFLCWWLHSQLGGFQYQAVIV